jgi:hypothetical protein
VGTWPLSAILDVLVEMQLTTAEWVDITSYCYGDPESEHISIERGRTSESAGITASKAELKLKNSDGRFDHRNPRGAWYGLFGRNTPLRVAVRPRLTTGAVADLADTFNRTVAAGNTWGTADTGQTWNRTTATLSNKMSVSSGTGRMLVSATTDTPGAKVTGALWKDYDLYLTFLFPVATGNSVFVLVSSRTTDASDSERGARLRCEMTTAGVVNLSILSTNPEGSSAQVGGTVTVSGLTHSGQSLRMRMRLAGITVMGKVWDASGAEPAAWQITRDDSTSRVAKPPGTIVITTNVGAGNTNVPFTAQYDNIALTAIEPRYCGEMTTRPYRWTTGAPDTGTVWVPVTSAGILGRLSSIQDQPKSALWRFIESNQTGLLGYWSLNKGEPAGLAGFEFQRPMLGTLTRRAISQGGAGVASTELGAGVLAGWLEPGAGVSAGGFVQFDRVNGPTNNGAGWAIDWVRAGGQNTDAVTPEVLIIATVASVSWSITFDHATSNIDITDPNGTHHTASLTASGVYDGGPHAIRFTTAKSGANITYNFAVDGSTVISGSIVAPDINGAGKLTTPVFQVGGAQTVAYGHVAIWDTSAPAVADYADAALGHAGELASDRIFRIAQEQALPWYVLGSESEALGQQPIGTPYTVLAAAAAADQGVLTELRDANGILYYARDTLYSQSATALAYSTDGHLQAPPEPTDDDVLVVNSATVTRQYASSQTFEQTTGPLGTANPPAGVGRKPGDTTLNLDDDVRTLHAAEWLVALGTIDDSRWPNLQVALHHLADHGLHAVLTSVMRTDAGFRITVSGPPDFLPPGTIDQLVLGTTETLDQYLWLVAFNCGPFAAYRVGVWSGTDEFLGRWDAVNSTLAADATSSATSLSVATSSGSLWTTSAADFPFDVNIRGVRITVTNITGAASPQTFTVTRSVDGFDLALTAGAAVSLWNPTRWGL